VDWAQSCPSAVLLYVLQCVAVCFSVLHCISMCCSVCCSVLQYVATWDVYNLVSPPVRRVLQCFAVCCSTGLPFLHTHDTDYTIPVCMSYELQCVVVRVTAVCMYCSVLQCVPVSTCSSVLQLPSASIMYTACIRANTRSQLLFLHTHARTQKTKLLHQYV